ncbi:protein phosphatase 2C domain-containing protein [Streptomyces iconiensis]|uniref:Protein phosphatase 2C domain-containing protein n=1 Tax=Streptomyces iconiensis TaxID=1384038 RepID=A0ABT7A6F5_9ACTN|nr:protein phosphatase 2C domain-containing protein [Streptomyces iconiensis]MDJ1136924.1 protein phosphatase 2C domain-containing protein [Streptomyces iconiensis]
MSDQGEQRAPFTSEHDDWWAQLYDAEATDTGRTRAPDTLDDRFASITRTVGGPEAPADTRTGGPPSEPEPEPAAPSRPEDASAPVPGARSAQRPAPSSSLDEPALLDEPPAAPAPEPGPRPEQGQGPAREPLAATGPESGPEPGPEADGDASGNAPAPGDIYGEVPEVEPGALPVADPAALGELVPDTALEGAHYGVLTLRAVSMRGEAARQLGMLRGDALLVARFGAGQSALLLVAVAVGSRTGPGAHRAAREACRSIGGAIGRSHARLAEDILAGRRDALKSGLHRLTGRTLGMLRAEAAALGLEPGQHTAHLRCLLLPADPRCRTRVFFGAGEGGLFRLRDGVWQDLEPRVDESERSGGPVLGYGAEPVPPRQESGAQQEPQQPSPTMRLGIVPPDDPTARAAAARDGFTEERQPEPARSEPFRFRASVAQPGDALLLCGAGVAEPLREDPGFAGSLAARWTGTPPGLTAYLAALQRPLKGHELDRTAATVWDT